MTCQLFQGRALGPNTGLNSGLIAKTTLSTLKVSSF